MRCIKSKLYCQYIYQQKYTTLLAFYQNGDKTATSPALLNRNSTKSKALFFSLFKPLLVIEPNTTLKIHPRFTLDKHREKPINQQDQIHRQEEEMIMVGVMAEILAEYTEAVAKVLEQLVLTNALPVPRRMRVWILRCLPFTTALPPPLPAPPHALRVVTRTH